MELVAPALLMGTPVMIQGHQQQPGGGDDDDGDDGDVCGGDVDSHNHNHH